jgi:hypothetical protein
VAVLATIPVLAGVALGITGPGGVGVAVADGVALVSGVAVFVSVLVGVTPAVGVAVFVAVGMRFVAVGVRVSVTIAVAVTVCGSSGPRPSAPDLPITGGVAVGVASMGIVGMSNPALGSGPNEQPVRPAGQCGPPGSHPAWLSIVTSAVILYSVAPSGGWNWMR